MAQHMPCVATADTNYCSLKTEPVSFRTTGVPPKLCVIEEVRRKENSAPWSSVSGTGRHTDFLGQVGQVALLKELLGFCCAAQCLFSLDKAQTAAMRWKGAIAEWLIPARV